MKRFPKNTCDVSPFCNTFATFFKNRNCYYMSNHEQDLFIKMNIYSFCEILKVFPQTLLYIKRWYALFCIGTILWYICNFLLTVIIWTSICGTFTYLLLLSFCALNKNRNVCTLHEDIISNCSYLTKLSIHTHKSGAIQWVRKAFESKTYRVWRPWGQGVSLYGFGGDVRVITQRLLAWELPESIHRDTSWASHPICRIISTSLRVRVRVCVTYLILRSCLESRLLQRWRFHCCSLALF